MDVVATPAAFVVPFGPVVGFVKTQGPRRFTKVTAVPAGGAGVRLNLTTVAARFNVLDVPHGGATNAPVSVGGGGGGGGGGGQLASVRVNPAHVNVFLSAGDRIGSQ